VARQRGKIQEESLYYEAKKHDGSLPLIGVNTFLPKEGQEDEAHEQELIRSTEGEKNDQIDHVRAFQRNHADESADALARLQSVARERGNVFAELMETVKSSSLGQVSAALYDVGGFAKEMMQCLATNSRISISTVGAPSRSG
jgi:methylmalonyl-CoA mutase